MLVLTSNIKNNALTQLMTIVQSAAQAATIEAQVQEIVDSISESLSVDVCSLYRRMHNDSLQLVASHGLITPHPILFLKIAV